MVAERDNSTMCNTGAKREKVREEVTCTQRLQSANEVHWNDPDLYKSTVWRRKPCICSKSLIMATLRT